MSESVHINPGVVRIDGSRSTLLVDFSTGSIARIPGNLRGPLATGSEQARQLGEFIVDKDMGKKVTSSFSLPAAESREISLPPTPQIAELEISEYLLSHLDRILERLENWPVDTYFFILPRPDYNLLERCIKALAEHAIVYNLLLNTGDQLPTAALNLLLAHDPQISRIHTRCHPNNADAWTRNLPRINVISEHGKIKVDRDIYHLSRQFHPYFFSRFFLDASGHYRNAHTLSEQLGSFPDDSDEAVFAGLRERGLHTAARHRIRECRACEFRRLCIDNSSLTSVGNGDFTLSNPCAFAPPAT